jgi:hypothetical protein
MTWEDFCAECLPEPATVVVEAHRGEGPVGPVWDQAQQVQPCYLDAGRKLVRAPDGSQVVSEVRVLAPAATRVPVGSRITLPGGTTTTVISAKVHSAHGLELPEHLEVACE